MSAETDLADGVVLVLTPEDTPAGTGFAVSKRLLVTCFHVVQPELGEPPPETVNVVFHATGDRRRTRVRAKATVVPESWRGCEAEDVAFLRVDQVPDQVKVLPLGSADGVDRDEVGAFGYPETGEIEGIGGTGHVVRQVRASGRPLLQLDSTEITSGFSGGPLWDRQKRRVIGMVTSIAKPDRYGKLGETAFATPTEVLQEICPALEPSDVCPYVGLESFGKENADFFFGRDELVKKLVSRLGADQRFLALLGPSGSGKSSVIAAGLIPRLEAGGLTGSRSWGYVTIRPGANPFESVPFTEFGDKSLAGSFGQWMRALGYSRGVLVIDQFEELLMLTPAGLRADFVAQLVDLLDGPLPVTVVLVMRNDFYGRLDDGAPALLRWMQEEQGQGPLNILPLERDELDQIIRKPAEEVGLDFEEGLLEMILDEATEVRAEGGAIRSTILPLVEFALTKTWELWKQSYRQGELTHQAYRDSGGISGAIAQWAESVYHGLDDQKRPIAKSIFLDLVHVADEEEMSDIRQRKDLSSLCPAIEDRASVEEVVNMLAAKRLVITDERLVITGERRASVELVHDALIWEWGPLHRWISEERPFRRWLQEMEPALRSWADYVRRDRGGEKPDWLRGQRLVEAERWRESRGTVMSPDLRDLIKDSRRVWNEEAERKRQAEALRLATHSELAMHATHPAPVVALALAVESVLTEPTVQGDIAIRRVLRLHPRTLARFDHDRRVTSVAFSLDGTRLATGSTDSHVRVFDLATGAKLVQLRHDGPVTAVAFSPDGAQVATGSDDHFARVFDAATGAELARFGHDRPVEAVQFSPDGTRVATGSDDHFARVFDMVTGAELARLDHDGPVYAVAFSPDGARVATGSDDHFARVFDMVTGAELARLDHDGPVTAVAFSPDGTRVATGSEDRCARVFDAATGAVKARLQHDHGVYAVAFGPDGRRVATGSSDHSARVFDAVTGAELARLEHDGPVYAVAFGPDGTRVATGSEDHSARVFDPATGAELARLDHDGPVAAVAFSPDGTRVATGSTDNHARVFNAATGAVKACLEHGHGVYAVAFSPDGTAVATGSWDGSARVFNAATGKERARLNHGGPVHAVAFSPDGAWVATGSDDQSARVFDAGTGKERARLNHDGPVRTVAFSLDGAWVVTGSEDGSARVFDAATGAVKARLEHGNGVYAVAFSPDGTRVATGSDDGSARVFDPATGAELARLDHDGEVTAVAFSPDSAWVATGSEDQSARVFNAVTGEVKARLDHDGEVTAVAFSRDGTRVATGSEDRCARVFKAATGAELARLDHDGEVTAVAFSPDGDWVITGSTDKTARVFEAAPGPLVQRALHAMDRPLNPAELCRYSLPPDCQHIRRWNRLRGQPAPRDSAGN